MRDLLKSFFAFGLATTLEKLIAFALVPLYVNIFSIEEFGIIDLIQVTIGILTVFGFLQFESALQRYYYDYKGLVKRGFITMVYVVVIALSLLIVFLVLLLAPSLSILLFETDKYSNLLIISVSQIPFNNVIVLSLLILRYERQNIKFTILLLFKVIITLFLILFFVLNLKKGIEGIFIARLIGGFISMSIVLIFMRKNFVLNFSKKILIKSIRYSLPLVPASIGSVLSANANRFFITTFLTMSAVGIYAFSLKIASVMHMVYIAFIMAWGPFLFSKLKEKNHKRYFADILMVIATPVFIFVIGLSLFAKEIVQLISPIEFEQSTLYVGGLALYYSLFIIKEVVDVGPKATEKTKYISYNYLVTLMFNFILLFFLIKYLDIEGVVISMILTNTILVILSWIVSNKIYYISHHLFDFALVIIPAYVISLLVMFIDFSFIIRISLLIFMFIGYLLFFYKYFNKVRSRK